MMLQLLDTAKTLPTQRFLWTGPAFVLPGDAYSGAPSACSSLPLAYCDQCQEGAASTAG